MPRGWAVMETGEIGLRGMEAEIGDWEGRPLTSIPMNRNGVHECPAHRAVGAPPSGLVGGHLGPQLLPVPQVPDSLLGHTKTTLSKMVNP